MVQWAFFTSDELSLQISCISHFSGRGVSIQAQTALGLVGVALKFSLVETLAQVVLDALALELLFVSQRLPEQEGGLSMQGTFLGLHGNSL
jgi:hypothetical protein